MNKVSSSITINAPIQKVFEYTASPENGPSFIPNLNENSNISVTPTQVGQKWNWRFNMVGVDFIGSAEVTKVDTLHVWELSTTGGVASTWKYAFEEKDGGTMVNLSVEYDMPQGVVGKVTANAIEKINQKNTDEALQHLKTILED